MISHHGPGMLHNLTSAQHATCAVSTTDGSGATSTHRVTGRGFPIIHASTHATPKPVDSIKIPPLPEINKTYRNLKASTQNSNKMNVSICIRVEHNFPHIHGLIIFLPSLCPAGIGCNGGMPGTVVSRHFEKCFELQQLGIGGPPTPTPYCIHTVLLLHIHCTVSSNRPMAL